MRPVLGCAHHMQAQAFGGGTFNVVIDSPEYVAIQNICTRTSNYMKMSVKFRSSSKSSHLCCTQSCACDVCTGASFYLPVHAQVRALICMFPSPSLSLAPLFFVTGPAGFRESHDLKFFLIAYLTCSSILQMPSARPMSGLFEEPAISLGIRYNF